MSAKRLTIRWDGTQAIYRVDVPNWDGGTVVMASDYDAMDSAATALGNHVQLLEGRIAKLEQSVTDTAVIAQERYERIAQLEAALSEIANGTTQHLTAQEYAQIWLREFPE